MKPTAVRKDMPPPVGKPQVIMAPTPKTYRNPEETPKNKEIPAFAKPKEEEPVATPPKEETPEATPPKEELPSQYIEENCVTIAGKKIEIKPTKLAYFRNHTATTYGILRHYPITELYKINKPGILDETRDGDQVIYDFLVASLDDQDFVREHYNDMEADQVDRIVKIVGRLNHIEEKEEEARKNREAQAKP